METLELMAADRSKFKIDKEDFDLLGPYKWRPQKGKGYIVYHGWNNETKKTTTVFLHREIMRKHGLLEDGLFVDHINRDRCDNRKENLRMVTSTCNTYNVSVRPRLSRSGARGIYWRAERNKWAAFISQNGKSHTKLFKTRDEAEAYRQHVENVRWLSEHHRVTPEYCESY